MRVVQGKLSFLAYSHQRGKLVKRFLTTHSLYIISLTKHGVGRRNGNLAVVFQARNNGTRHGTYVNLHQASAEDNRIGDTEDTGIQFGILPATFLLEPPCLLVEVDTQHARQQLDKQDDAYHTEWIGNTVGNGSQRRTRTVNGYRQTGGTGQCAGNEAHHTGCIDVEGIFQPYGRKSRRADNEQREQNKRLTLAAEGIKESWSRLDTDGEDEQHQSEVAQFLGDDDSEVPEQQGNENNG